MLIGLPVFSYTTGSEVCLLVAVTTVVSLATPVVGVSKEWSVAEAVNWR